MDIKIKTDDLKFKFRVSAVFIHDCKLLVDKYRTEESYCLPGGYVNLGETSSEGMIREIKEELTIEINVESYLGEKVFEYPEKSINLIALNCRVKSGNIYLTEHEEARWVEKEELNSFEFAPADIFIVKKLQGIEKYSVIGEK